MNKLNLAAKILQNSRTYNSMKNDNEEWLVILVNCHSKENKNSNYETFDYRGYVYNFTDKSFSEISASHKTLAEDIKNDLKEAIGNYS